MDRLEEKRKIKAQAFHERKVRQSIVFLNVQNSFSRRLQPSSCAKRLWRTTRHRRRPLHSLATRRSRSRCFLHSTLPTMIHRHEPTYVSDLCPAMRLMGTLREYDVLLNRAELSPSVYRIFYLYNSIIRALHNTLLTGYDLSAPSFR